MCNIGSSIIMRKSFLIILNLFCVPCLTAQTNEDFVRYREVLLSAEKRSVIDHAMKLSLVEASVFWPLYESYERTRRSLTSSHAIRINEYLKGNSSMTEKKSHRYAKHFLMYNKQLLQVHNLYYKRLRQAIGSVKANKFIQLEMRIQNEHTYEMQENMPFINEVQIYVISSETDQ